MTAGIAWVWACRRTMAEEQARGVYPRKPALAHLLISLFCCSHFYVEVDGVKDTHPNYDS